MLEGWRRHHNTVRPLSSLAYQPPALDGVAEQWRMIIDRLGLESQKEAYRLTLGLK